MRAVVVGFLAGSCAANSVPHLTKGLTGQHHMTPFGRGSSPVVNAIWGTANAVAAAALWNSRAAEERHPAAPAAAAAGALVTAVVLAQMWGRHPEWNLPRD